MQQVGLSVSHIQYNKLNQLLNDKEQIAITEIQDYKQYNSNDDSQITNLANLLQKSYLETAGVLQKCVSWCKGNCYT